MVCKINEDKIVVIVEELMLTGPGKTVIHLNRTDLEITAVGTFTIPCAVEQ
jgi:hypothetical protein